MKAFVGSLSNFFKLNTEQTDFNFDETKRRLLIPIYQREYKWTDDKIISLISDIKRRDKFLGNVILDESEGCYEIVDGQQRITTCFITLMCLFNSYSGHVREQQSILNLMKPYNDTYILQNDSVGDYLSDPAEQIHINILPNNDVYYQNESFIRASSTIADFILSLQTQECVHEFKQKLLDCQFLVLINDNHNHTRPVEQLFLDINEKAQLLEVEDIFKGHCFENYNDEDHNNLRNIWVELKKCGMNFMKFGFEDTSQYIYLYLLEQDDSSIPENLTISGRHYLEGKTMDDTEKLLNDMISYGNAVVNFYKHINQDDYRFSDLCTNSHEYRNTDDHKMLKHMCSEMLLAKAQYPKLPLMYFIYSISTNNLLRSEFTHPQFKKIITNLYIYASLIALNGGRKSKQIIDHSVRDALIDIPISISSVIDAVKTLRNDKVSEFVMANSYKFEPLSFIYSVMDYYVPNDNWIKGKYSRALGYNLEHFIIPDNRRSRITWKDENETFPFSLSQTISSKNKKKALNFLIIDDQLNEQIEHDDIVSKISAIKTWYMIPTHNLPKHINAIIVYIENMPEYMTLMNLKGTNALHTDIENAYNSFVETYFSDVSQQNVLLILQDLFKASFANG